MGIKVCFYPYIIDKGTKEVDLSNNYCSTNYNCIYSIKAGEICSEFIARYFFKPGTAPENFINEIAKNSSKEKDIKQEISKNIYKVKIQDMLQDSNSDFEFKTYKECKKVRENLLNKYENIELEIEDKIKNANIDIYALLELE